MKLIAASAQLGLVTPLAVGLHLEIGTAGYFLVYVEQFVRFDTPSGSRDEGILEPSSLICQTVQVRRFGDRMTGDVEGMVALIVDENEYDCSSGGSFSAGLPSSIRSEEVAQDSASLHRTCGR